MQKATNMPAATAVLTTSEEVNAPIDVSAFRWLVGSLSIPLLDMVFVICVLAVVSCAVLCRLLLIVCRPYR